jgi:hypothetical protein
MNNLPGFGLLLFAAIGIGMMGTLTKVMSQHAYAQKIVIYPLCPPGYLQNARQTPSDELSHGLKCDGSVPETSGQVKYVPLTPSYREKVCTDLGKPQNC